MWIYRWPLPGKKRFLSRNTLLRSQQRWFKTLSACRSEDPGNHQPEYEEEQEEADEDELNLPQEAIA